MGWIFLGATVLFTVIGQLAIRQQLGEVDDVPRGLELFRFLLGFVLTRPVVLAAFGAAFLASLFWMATLTRFELSFAYPFLAVNFVVVFFLSIAAFGETINSYKIAGLLLVCGGLAVLAQGS